MPNARLLRKSVKPILLDLIFNARDKLSAQNKSN